MTATRLNWARASADGQLVTGSGVLCYARLTTLDPAASKDVAVGLREGTAAGGPVLIGLVVATGLPDEWPRGLVRMPFTGGIYVTFSGGTATNRLLVVGWNEF